MRNRPFPAILMATVMAIATLLPVGARAQSEQSTPASPLPPAQFTIKAETDNANGYLAVELAAGASKSVTVSFGMTASGSGSRALVFRADAYSQVNGGFGARSVDDPVAGAGAWLDFEAEAFDFEPGEGAQRTLAISVPESTDPGEYVAALVIQNAAPVEIANNVMFDQVVRWALPVLITVPGELSAAIELGEPTISLINGRRHFELPLINTGNRTVRPAGQALLSDPASGASIATIPIEMGSFYAGDATSISIAVGDSIPAGSYNVALEISDEPRGLTPVTWQGRLDIPDPDAQQERAPVEIASAELSPMPDAASVTYLDASIVIDNRADPVTNARVLLDVFRDGELVESYPLASSLLLATGQTRVEQRYLPAGGFTPGRYTFAIVLETVDPASGVATVLARRIVDGELPVGL